MVVSDIGEIIQQKWTINGKEFQVVSSKSTGKFDSVWTTKDTIKYPDGTYEEMTRRQLREKFKHL